MRGEPLARDLQSRPQTSEVGTMTMSPFLKDNISALEKANPALYAWLSSSPFDEQSLKTSIFVN